MRGRDEHDQPKASQSSDSARSALSALFLALAGVPVAPAHDH